MKHIGRFEIIRQLGAGGFGSVYLARDPNVERDVALKVLSAAHDPSLLERFRAEAKAAGRLRHPNIVTIYEFGEADGDAFIAMEYVRGNELRQLIADGHVFSPYEATDIMWQVAQALGAAHSHGVIHRDIKPGNIVITPEGEARVLDFGIARLTGEQASRITQADQMLGTPLYMAPEQFSGAPGSPATDWWAYGMVFYEMLAGRHPFTGANHLETVYKVAHAEVPALGAARPDLPDSLIRLVMRFLERDVARRLADIPDVLREMDRLLPGLREPEVRDLENRVRALLQDRRRLEALPLVRRLLRCSPGHPEARRWLGEFEPSEADALNVLASPVTRPIPAEQTTVRAPLRSAFPSPQAAPTAQWPAPALKSSAGVNPLRGWYSRGRDAAPLPQQPSTNRPWLLMGLLGVPVLLILGYFFLWPRSPVVPRTSTPSLVIAMEGGSATVNGRDWKARNQPGELDSYRVELALRDDAGTTYAGTFFYTPHEGFIASGGQRDPPLPPVVFETFPGGVRVLAPAWAGWTAESAGPAGRPLTLRDRDEPVLVSSDGRSFEPVPLFQVEGPSLQVHVPAPGHGLVLVCGLAAGSPVVLTRVTEGSHESRRPAPAAPACLQTSVPAGRYQVAAGAAPARFLEVTAGRVSRLEFEPTPSWISSLTSSPYWSTGFVALLFAGSYLVWQRSAKAMAPVEPAPPLLRETSGFGPLPPPPHRTSVIEQVPPSRLRETGDLPPLPPLPPAEPPVDGSTQIFRTAPVRDTTGPVVARPPAPPPPADDRTQLFPLPGVFADPTADAGVALVVVKSNVTRLVGERELIRSLPHRLGSEGLLSADSAVSRAHAEIDLVDGNFVIRDLGSRNGTYLEGRRLEEGKAAFLPFRAPIVVGLNTVLTLVHAAPEPPPDLVGATLAGRYVLRAQESTRSARSFLYRGEDRQTGQPVSVKILDPRMSRYPAYRDQFLREARLAGQVRHPHVNRLLDFGTLEHGGQSCLFLCMERLGGGTLADRLAAGATPPDMRRVTEWLTMLAGALDHVHGKEIIHGSLKPTSILFDELGNPYLSDFARAMVDPDLAGRQVTGAPAFLAPEQWDGQAPTPATDLYSLAAIFFQLITGALPYEGQEDPAMRARNFAAGPPSAHAVAARGGRALPAALSVVLTQALATDPSARHASASAFADAFRRASERIAAVRTPRVFMSHSNKVSGLLAKHLKAQLEANRRCIVYVAEHDEWRPGHFPDRLKAEIEGCDAFVCLLAEGTLESPWVRSEIVMAQAAGRPLIPALQESYVRLEQPADLPLPVQQFLDLHGVQLFDVRSEFLDDTISMLYKAILKSCGIVD